MNLSNSSVFFLSKFCTIYTASGCVIYNYEVTEYISKYVATY